MFHTKSVDACPDLVAALLFRVVRGQRVEKCAVSAAEITDANRTVAVDRDLEMLAGKIFIRHAHVTFAADDESVRRNLEFLSEKRSVDADEHGTKRLRQRFDRSRAQRFDLGLIAEDLRGVEFDGLDARAAFTR